MTRAEEQAFIALWEQGLTCPKIAQRLNIPPGTARSRAYSLQQRGLILPRPKGGRRVPARREGAPASPPADSALPTRDPPAITMVTVPELRELIHRFSGLEGRVAALEDGTRAGGY